MTIQFNITKESKWKLHTCNVNLRELWVLKLQTDAMNKSWKKVPFSKETSTPFYLQLKNSSIISKMLVKSKIKIPTVDGSLGTITSGASPPWLAEWLQLVWRIAGVHMQSGRRLIDSTAWIVRITHVEAFLLISSASLITNNRGYKAANLKVSFIFWKVK